MDKRINREPVRLSATTPKGGEIGFESYKVEQDATIESITVRFYKGAELLVEVLPYIAGFQERRRKLIDGADIIKGDDDELKFKTSMPVLKGESIVMQYQNNEPNDTTGYDHYVWMDIELDYMGGEERVVL